MNTPEYLKLSEEEVKQLIAAVKDKMALRAMPNQPPVLQSELNTWAGILSVLIADEVMMSATKYTKVLATLGVVVELPRSKRKAA